MRRRPFCKFLFAFGSIGFSSRLFCSALKEISAGAVGTGVSSACFGGFLPRLRNTFMARETESIQLVPCHRLRALGSKSLSPEKWQADGKQEISLYCLNRSKSLIINGVPGGIRTPNLLIRSQMLYPVELQTQSGKSFVRSDR